MQRVNLPIGTSDFAEIRREGWYYVDKTGLIGDLLNTRKAKVTLITRPRRFGKTLGMNMLANFFDIRKDSKALFEGLEVSKDQALCEQWRNQYPTLFLSFKDVDGLCFEDAFDLLKFTLSQFCIDHNELGEQRSRSYNEAAILCVKKQDSIGRRNKNRTAHADENDAGALWQVGHSVTG